MMFFANHRFCRKLSLAKTMAIAALFYTLNINGLYASEVDQQAWGHITLKNALNNHPTWSARFDSHTRWSHQTNQRDIGILQGSLNHKLSERLTLGVGLDRMAFYRDSGDIIEKRVWEQAVYPIHSVAGGSLSGRTRVEHRQRNTGNIGHRARQLLRWTKAIGDSQWSWVVTNELFINLNDTRWGQNSGVDQNHTLLGINYRPASSWKVESGYVHMRLNRNKNQTVHALQTQVLFFF